MAELDIQKELFELLDEIKLQYYGNDHTNDIIIHVDFVGFDTVVFENNGDHYLIDSRDGTKAGFGEFSEDVQYDYYKYLYDNRRTLKFRTNLIEHEKPEEKEWHLDPDEITLATEENEVVGMLGVEVMEALEEKKILAPIFLSPDGTYATLTMWGSDSEEEKAQALADLEIIKNGITELIKRIRDEEVA